MSEYIKKTDLPMREIILKKRYPHSREEDITDAFMRGYVKGKADRPQGEWTKTDVATYRCSECGKIQIADDDNELNFCCCCGSRNKVRRLKGADDE